MHKYNISVYLEVIILKIYKFLIVAVLIFMTVGAASAADSTTQDNSAVTAGDSSDMSMSETCNQDNNVSGDEKMSIETSDNHSSEYDENMIGQAKTTKELSESDYDVSSSSGEDYKGIFYDNKYYLFRGDCWTINNNFESSATITSETLTDLTVTGVFRTENDFVGLYWNSQDLIQHPYISYGNRSNYSDVILEFDYEMTGCNDFSNNAVITIEANTGEIYYLTMSRYITNNHVKLDFSDLILRQQDTYIDRNGNPVTVTKRTKLNTDNLKSIMIPIVPTNFVANYTNYTIMENANFTCRISNISVINGEICNEQPQLPSHQIRLCEGYDDIYNLNPYRLCKEMRKLGYTEWADLYIGASNFYEKSGTVGDVISDMGFTNNRTEKMVLDKDVPLNNAFRAWLDCYSRELKNNGIDNLVISISMENLQCPQSWRQMDLNGNLAKTGWNPSTFFYSPCNEEVIQYVRNVSEACLDIVVNNGFQPILQMGEAWWWWNENTEAKAPCFYDNATKARYFAEYGTELPEYAHANIEDYDRNVTKWLNQQLVKYSDSLRDVVKSAKYSDGIYMALFFPPSGTDIDNVPPMIRDVNYIQDAYSPSKLDVLQIEDYDWVTGKSPHHQEAYLIGQELGFTEDQLHYFGGFVLNPEDADRLWELIEEAIDEAFERNFKEVFVWAGSQVRRDSKVLGHDEEMIMNNLTPTTTTSPSYVSVGENFTIEIKTQEWINGQLNVYDYNSGAKGDLLASSEIANGSASVDLSSTYVGLNRFYLEFIYSGEEYHLVQEVYVIENSQNITVDVPSQVEYGSDANITFNAPASTTAFIYISIDKNAQDCYPVENGEFEIAIKNLTLGNHTISIKYNDGSYIGGKLVGEVYSNTFNVHVYATTSIETNNVTADYDSGKNLTAVLKDNMGNALKGKDILIRINGKDHVMTTDNDGQVSLAIDLLPDSYLAEISFIGDDVYLSSSANASVIVNKIATRLTSNNVNVVYNNPANLVITLKDNVGKALAKKSIVIYLNNVKYSKSTDANGQVKLSVNLPAKVYSAKISFAGSEIYKASSITSKITVKKATPKLVASSKKFKAKAKTKKVTAKLKNNKNKAIKRVIVKLKVNKKTYKAKTNSKGIATFKVKLTKKGKYTATYKFAGNSNYKSATKKVKITIR